MRNPVIRTIYLYLFALVGLGMLVVGAAMIINLGLKAWIFTKADQMNDYYARPVTPYIVDPDLKNVQQLQACEETCNLTEAQREQIANWLVDYETWQNNEKNIDPNANIIRNRQRQAATALSLILVGLPLWLFHWGVIKRDVKSSAI